MKNELMNIADNGQLSEEDEEQVDSLKRKLRCRLKNNPSSDDLQAIKDQLELIFDRVSEQRN